MKVKSCVQLFATPWTIQSMEFSRPKYWSGEPFPSPGDLPDSGIKSRSPVLQVDSLPAEPLGKPQNTGMDSLSLFQWIFLTQDSNCGLLHCRQILNQLSYQGSPPNHWTAGFPRNPYINLASYPVSCAVMQGHWTLLSKFHPDTEGAVWACPCSSHMPHVGPGSLLFLLPSYPEASK